MEKSHPEVHSSMKSKSLFSLAVLFMLVAPTLCRAQDDPPKPAEAPVATVIEAPPALAPAIAAYFPTDNFLGVQVEDVTRANMSAYGLSGEPRGVAVTRVINNGPAERAGLREKDVILRFDGEPVTSVRKLNRLIAESSPEHNARLSIARGGAEQELSVKLEKRDFDRTFQTFAGPAFEGDLWHRGDELKKQLEGLQRNNHGGFPYSFGTGRRIGVSTNSLGKQLADYFGVTNGVLVTSVEDNSPAAKAGLKAGDILTEIDGEQIKDSGDLSRTINRKEEGEVTLTVVRDKQRRSVKVTPERRQPPPFNVTTPGVYSLPRIAAAPIMPRAVVQKPGVSSAVLAAPRPAITLRPAIIRAPHGLLVEPRMSLRMHPDVVIERKVL
jgi:serine protease Do